MAAAEFAEKRLLPTVKEFVRLGGECLVPASLRVQVADSRVARWAERWLKSIPRDLTNADSSQTLLTVIEQPGHVPHRDGYRLRIDREGVRLTGESSAGCFYGLQTLAQLACGQTAIPRCEISDWPDFSTRGLLHDTTRGKVPTLGTLKHLADRLAGLKINQLQLYIEHSFVFAFDPQIADPQNGLTSDEVRELDVHCRERFIDLVPAVATLGHMGRILSLPQYRHLAEIEPEASWETMTWPERARGFTLDVLNPQSHALVERIWSEILDAFSSPVVNLCGDEPWDLGKGRNRIPADRIGEAYIDHIVRTHAICTRRGRRTQVWSDVVRNHPDLLGRLPRDLTVMHWGYDDRSDYEGTARFVESGLETLVCPGTSGWKRVLNAMDSAERNIAAFARAGKQQGASGLLNTDWGDHGHFNALACSWHGIALGAALAWRADHAFGAEFDRQFADWLFEPNRENQEPRRAQLHELIFALRGASKIAERCETWRLLWQPLHQLRDDPTKPSLEVADSAADYACRASQMLHTLPSCSDRDELLVACFATHLFRDKLHLARAESMDTNKVRDRIRDVSERVARCWNARNKPSGLKDILAVFDRLRIEFGVS